MSGIAGGNGSLNLVQNGGTYNSAGAAVADQFNEEQRQQYMEEMQGLTQPELMAAGMEENNFHDGRVMKTVRGLKR